ncbi:MAG: hypothetical protein JWR84_3573 [Caulobacter sp.]|nr:hypothetical protein [Caulobacter sp.]
MDQFLAFAKTTLGDLPQIIAALVILCISVLTQIRTYRAHSDNRFLTTDERTKLIAFWLAWYDAKIKVSDEAGIAEAKAMASQHLALLAKSVEAPQPPPANLVFARTRSALLLDDPGGRTPLLTWALRAPFFLLALALAALVIALFHEAADTPTTSVWTPIMVAVFGTMLLSAVRLLYRRPLRKVELIQDIPDSTTQ